MSYANIQGFSVYQTWKWETRALFILMPAPSELPVCPLHTTRSQTSSAKPASSRHARITTQTRTVGGKKKHSRTRKRA